MRVSYLDAHLLLMFLQSLSLLIYSDDVTHFLKVFYFSFKYLLLPLRSSFFTSSSWLIQLASSFK